MEIKLTIQEQVYTIDVEPSCFSAYQHGTQQKGKNIGEPTKSPLGYFSTLSSAVKKITQNHMSEQDEVITLKDYAERVEAAYTELMIQIGDK